MRNSPRLRPGLQLRAPPIATLARSVAVLQTTSFHLGPSPTWLRRVFARCQMASGGAHQHPARAAIAPPTAATAPPLTPISTPEWVAPNSAAIAPRIDAPPSPSAIRPVATPTPIPASPSPASATTPPVTARNGWCAIEQARVCVKKWLTSPKKDMPLGSMLSIGSLPA